MFDAIDRLIKQDQQLRMRQHLDGRIQADIGNHHAQGPSVEVALRRLDAYLSTLTTEAESMPRRGVEEEKPTLEYAARALIGAWDNGEFTEGGEPDAYVDLLRGSLPEGKS